MFKAAAIGQYYPGDSFFHRLEPRIKIGLIAIYVISLFLFNTYRGYLAMSLFTLAVIVTSRLPYKLLLRGLKPLYVILAFNLVLHIFLTKGVKVLFQCRKISIESQGVISGLMMAWRLVLLVMTSSCSPTTSPIALTDAIEGLLSPLKPIGVPAASHDDDNCSALYSHSS